MPYPYPPSECAQSKSRSFVAKLRPEISFGISRHFADLSRSHVMWRWRRRYRTFLSLREENWTILRDGRTDRLTDGRTEAHPKIVSGQSVLYTVSQKTLQLWQAVVSISVTNFDIFAKQHQHTFKNDLYIQLSLSLYFYLLCLLLNSWDGNNAF